MTEYTTGYTLGYVDETSYGVRDTTATPAVVTNALGEHIESPAVPTAVPEMVEIPQFNSFDPSSIRYGRKVVAFDIPYNFLEANSLIYILGKESRSVKVHTLAGIEPADGTALRSRTLHYETFGLTTNKLLDVCGIVTEQLTLSWAEANKEEGIKAVESFVGQRITDESATQTTGVTGATATAAIPYMDGADSKPPVLHDTDVTVADPYIVTAVTHNTTDILGDIMAGTIGISVELLKRYNGRGEKTDNYNHTLNNYIDEPVIRKRGYEIILTIMPSANVMTFFNSLNTNNYNNDLIITMSRTVNAVAHSIVWTFDVTTCLVTDVSGAFNMLTGGDMGWTVSLKPKTLVSCISTDNQDADY